MSYLTVEANTDMYRVVTTAHQAANVDNLLHFCDDLFKRDHVEAITQRRGYDQGRLLLTFIKNRALFKKREVKTSSF